MLKDQRPRDQWARQFGVVAAASLAGQGLAVARELMFARLLAPTHYGMYRLLAVAYNFLSYSHAGLLSALGTYGPVALGRGDDREYEEIRRTSWSWMLLAAVLAGLSVLGARAIGWLTAFSWTAICMFVGWSILGQMTSYALTLLTVNQSFGIFALLQVLCSAAALFLGLVGVTRWGMEGALLAMALSQTLPLLVGRCVFGEPVRFVLNWTDAFRWIRAGWAITVNTLLVVVTWKVDSLLVYLFLDPEQLGYYAVASSAIVALQVLPQSIGRVIAPELGRRIGRGSGALADATGEWFREQSALVLAISLVLVGAAYVLFPTVVQALLPQYVPAVRPFQLLLVGFYFTQQRVVAGPLLNAVGLAHRYLAVQVAAVGVQCVVLVAALWQGAGLLGAAAAGVCASMVVGLVVVVQAFGSVFGCGWKGFSFNVRSVTALSLSIAGLVVLDQIWSQGPGVLAAGTRAAGGIAVHAIGSMLMCVWIFPEFRRVIVCGWKNRSG